MTKEHKTPIAIGGIGGSGTRLIAQILINLGFDLGNDLNESNDNLWFTLLFKRQELWPPSEHSSEIQQAYDIFKRAMLGQLSPNSAEKQYIGGLTEDRPQHNKIWLTERKESIFQLKTNIDSKPWGWKEPNTHIILPEILKAEPALKYIHVIRHGLDMAYSTNQNQLSLWGEHVLGHKIQDTGPDKSFEYWCEAHRRVLQTGKQMKNNFFLLNYDALCEDPTTHLPKLFSFIGIDVPCKQQNDIANIISTPSSKGRHKGKTINCSKKDLALLHELGFD